MKNTISKEKRLDIYKKALQMYETKNYPEHWLPQQFHKSHNFGLCQALRNLYTKQPLIDAMHVWPDGEKWPYDKTPQYFPEFGAHWNKKSLTDKQRIKLLKLCIADMK